ncbi:MAG: Unknown protein [uncultured Aureispira sp.]|uniref:HEAT repeat domain-containing protein n=1 Tax=uncultured Aureispira sp. TaxID=1331704 RepID=A0A6S6S1C0_9BACT|nr:MAG: Unknown protein [uncultured Aureispira sp.]
MTTTSTIRQHVEQFETWRKENHSAEQYAKGYTDDPSYPFWNAVESDLEALFKSGTLEKLPAEEKEGLIYLIARNWDIGNIINWLTISGVEPISYLGCTESDFLHLCPIALRSKEEDAKCQFVKVLPFLTTISKTEIRPLLLDFYHNGSAYTKRMALFALQAVKYPELEDLVQKSWADEGDEFYKIACLNVLHALKCKNLATYIKEAEGYKEWDFLQENVTRIKEEANIS